MLKPMTLQALLVQFLEGLNKTQLNYPLATIGTVLPVFVSAI
jgi:hypothetical protein